MPTKSDDNHTLVRWGKLDNAGRELFPHLRSFLVSNGDFAEFRLKARDDGTILAIAKGYDASGTSVVCFGVGYDPFLAILACDQTIQGGHWRVDKPWAPKA